MNRAPRDRRTRAAIEIARHLADHLQADLSLKLWDGTVVPLGEGARDDILLVLSSPAAVRRLILRPGLMTVVELFASGDIAIEGGSVLEATRRWDHLRALALRRTVDPWKLARLLLPFVRSGPASDQADRAGYGAAVRGKLEAGRDDKDLIRFHYDVSNAFYALFLGREMVYSAAYFPRDGMTLDEGQDARLEMTCRRLRLKPGEKLLDIGCGWGGLICYAAKHYGVAAHGVTLSEEQLAFVRAKIAAMGLEDRVTVELRDYRTVAGEGVYDAIAQIEMFEHVGIDNHDRHFQHIHKLLKMRGRYVHQATVRRATRDPAAFRRPTQYQKVITRFIFPGGELDHIGMTCTNLERWGFEVHDVENGREHFLRTITMWLDALTARRAEAEAEIGAPRTKLWMMYFSLFAVAFERGTCLSYQTLATKRQPGVSGLPMIRADLYRGDPAGQAADTGPPIG